MSSGPVKLPNPESEQIKVIRESLESFLKTKIDFERADTKTMMEHNRQSATFYEKLCVVNGGTLVLSLSLLGPALQYGVGHHLPHRAFFEFAVPAWLLLLISTYFSALRIVSAHNMNASLLKGNVSTTNEYYLGVLKGITQKNANLKIQSMQATLQGRMEEIDHLTEKEKALIKAHSEEALKHHTQTMLTSRLAFTFTIFGIALLCIFAIRVLSAL